MSLPETSGLWADALAVLGGWDTPSPQQQRLRTEYLARLRPGADALWRSGVPSHLTASSIVLTPDRRRTVLVLHRKLGTWVQPGGHCEPGDQTLAAVALREAREETGLADLAVAARPLRLQRTGAPCGGPARWHLDVQYVAVAPPDAVPRASAESADVRWFEVGRLPQRLASGVRESLAAATHG